MFTIQKSEWDRGGNVTRFELLVEVGNKANALAAEYVATVAGYVENTGYHLRVETLSPCQPLDAVVVLTHIAQHEDYIIEQVKKCEKVSA